MASAIPATADTLTYTNARFGTHVTFPAELFETREEPPVNGDGMTWTSQEGSSLAVFGSYNVQGLSVNDYLAQLVELRSDNAEVTYERNGKDWIVFSGLQGPHIFYERYEFGADSAVHGMILAYPKALEGKYNPLVGTIANSLGGP